MKVDVAGLMFDIKSSAKRAETRFDVKPDMWDAVQAMLKEGNLPPEMTKEVHRILDAPDLEDYEMIAFEYRNHKKENVVQFYLVLAKHNEWEYLGRASEVMNAEYMKKFHPNDPSLSD